MVIAEMNITIVIQIPVTRLDDFLVLRSYHSLDCDWTPLRRNPMKWDLSRNPHLDCFISGGNGYYYSNSNSLCRPLQATTKIHITIEIQIVIAEMNITIVIQIPVTRLDDFLVLRSYHSLDYDWTPLSRNPMKWNNPGLGPFRSQTQTDLNYYSNIHFRHDQVDASLCSKFESRNETIQVRIPT